MNVYNSPTEIHDNEWLARFVFSKSHFRVSDNTVKADAFIPYPYPNLSVTRHEGLSQEELWLIGQDYVGGQRTERTLYGRADILARDVRYQTLEINPDPPPNHHAVITGWPDEKPKQKIIALELAQSAYFLTNPNRS